MPTDQEIQKMYEEMQEMFNDLPNPDHEPRRFAYYVKLYLYYKGR